MTYLRCGRVFKELHRAIVEDCWKFGLQEKEKKNMALGRI
jgi:hypothetical protein